MTEPWFDNKFNTRRAPTIYIGDEDTYYTCDPFEFMTFWQKLKWHFKGIKKKLIIG